MVLTKKRSAFDWFCDIVLLVFLSVVMGYGPDNHRMFIPAEILFVVTFGIRFIVKRSTVTNPFVLWTFGFLFLSALSVLYANDQVLAFSRLKSVVQVLAFGNLLLPYIRENEASFKRFLHVYLFAILFVLLRLLLNTPLELFLIWRLGETIEVNPNTVGYMLSIAVLVAIYLGNSKKTRWYWVMIPLLVLLALYTGSRKVFILLGVGIPSIIILQQKTLKRSLVVLGVGVVLLIGSIFILMAIEPLRAVFGQRLLNMFSELSGSSADESTSIRMGMLVNGLKMFKQKPIFGWGLGAFTDLGGFDSYAHNNYVELLVAVGLVGTVIYYSLCFYIVVVGIKRFFKFEEKGPYILSTAIMMAMLFDQVGRVTYTEEYSNFLIALCYAGIVLDRPKSGLDLIGLFKKIGEYVMHPSRFINHLLKMRVVRLMPDATFVKIKYRMSNGKRANLKEPRTFNEKLQWQKLHDRNPLYPLLADKYEVRDYVSARIGENHLVPLVGVYDAPEDIVIEDLPSPCVIKPTHTSGDVLFCYDTGTFDWSHAKSIMKGWLSSNYYWYDREWPYKMIKPRIIIEHLIKTADGMPPQDYKIFCFNGEPKMAFVASDRPHDTKFDFFDVEWNRLELKQHYPNSTYEIPKPAQWGEMLEIARTLSKGFPQVRVDLYIDADENILFGELTLSHFSGFEPFEPDSFDELLGEWIELPTPTKE